MTNKIKELPPFPFKFTVNIPDKTYRVHTVTQHKNFAGSVQVDWDDDSFGDGTWYQKEVALRHLQMGDWQLVETPNEELLNKIKQFSKAGHEVIITNGEYRVIAGEECVVYKCKDEEALVKTMEALSYLDSLEVE